MLRMYRDFAAKVLLVLHYCQRTGTDLRGMTRWLENHPVGEDHVIRELLDGNSTYHNLDEMISELTKQLQQFSKGEGEQDLIDNIVTILGLPYSSAIFSNRNLSNLRQALFIPEEMAKFNAGARQRETACANCRTPFCNRELVTAAQTGPGSIGFYCSRCMTPESIGCNSCKRRASLGSRFIKRLKKGFSCEHHVPKEGDASDEGDVFQQEAIQDEVNGVTDVAAALPPVPDFGQEEPPRHPQAGRYRQSLQEAAETFRAFNRAGRTPAEPTFRNPMQPVPENPGNPPLAPGVRRGGRRS